MVLSAEVGALDADVAWAGLCSALALRTALPRSRNRRRLCRQRCNLDGIAEVLKSGDETFGLSGFGAAIEVVGSEILIAVAVLEHEVDGSEERSGDGADGLILAAPGTNALILSLKIAALLARRCPAALDQGGLEPWSSLAHAGGAPLAGTLIVLGAQPGNLIGSLHFPVTSRLYHLWASSLCALRLTNPACRTLMFRVAPILLSSSSRRPLLG